MTERLLYRLLRRLILLLRLKNFCYIYNSRRTWLNCKIFCSSSKRLRVSVHRGKLKSSHSFDIFEFLLQCLLLCQISLCGQLSQFDFLLVFVIFMIDNVDVNNRFVCYDIRELGKQLKKLGMLIVQDQVWNRVTINRAQHKATRYYMDEFHLLLKEEQTAAYSVEIWKRFRKWGGIPTGATQNPKDLLSSPEIENILENSDFIYLLNLSAGDRRLMTERLNISAEQLAYVTNADPGSGLLFFQNVILPFRDEFPKDTELYKLLTTKPGEVEHDNENG